MDDDVLLVVVWMMMYFVVRRRRRTIRWKNRRWWIRPVNHNRNTQGDFHHLFQELKTDGTMFHRYTRMDVETFNRLLNIVQPHLVRSHPRALSTEQRLSLTLRYLATGDQILSLALAYRIGESTCRIVIREVTEVLARILAPMYLKPPDEDEWKYISASFLDQWNLPNCIGAIDGKHIHVQAPPNSGSLYYNYKKTFSMVLLAVCDANYKFTLVHSGEMGGNSDAGIFADCPLGQMLREERLEIPAGVAQLPGSDISTPYFIVGDAAFPLSARMMKPYPGHGLTEKKKIFNYRLSRARRVIENAFGILASRWRIFRKPITLYPESVDNIIAATVCLHNFLRTRDEGPEPPRRLYVPPHYVDWEDDNGVVHRGRWRDHEGLADINPFVPQIELPNATNMRDTLASYLITPQGEVPWQYDRVRCLGNPSDE